MSFGTFFMPGPTEVRPQVLAAMTQPMIGHRGPAFEQLFARIQEGLQEVLRTSRIPIVSSSSATGLMEAAVRNAPPGRILSLVNGAFSERFADIARACGRDVDTIEVPWGGVSDPYDVRRTLSRSRYAALTVVHCETSTGALTDVAAMAREARELGVAVLVDSVSAAGGAPLETEEWQLDFVLTGSQKAFALPPGLAFGVASTAFVAGAAASSSRGRYFDLVEFERFGAKHQTPNTPALPLLYALDAQLAAIRTEGVEARWARHAEMAARMHAWVAETSERTGLSLGILAPADSRSPTVTTVSVPPDVNAREVVGRVAERGYVIGNGYGPLRDRTFRVGHMGDHTLETLEGCLQAIGDVLDELQGSGNRGQ